jgi:hypothetical protein
MPPRMEVASALWPALPYAAWKDNYAHTALVDADRRQDQARTDSLAQSLMACHALRIATGLDDIAHSLRDPHL